MCMSMLIITPITLQKAGYAQEHGTVPLVVAVLPCLAHAPVAHSDCSRSSSCNPSQVSHRNQNITAGEMLNRSSVTSTKLVELRRLFHTAQRTTEGHYPRERGLMQPVLQNTPTETRSRDALHSSSSEQPSIKTQAQPSQ